MKYLALAAKSICNSTIEPNSFSFFIADDHDVLKLSISSLRSPENAQVKNAAAEDADSKKIEEEFEQYQEKLKQQKADWEKEHPDQVRFIL